MTSLHELLAADRAAQMQTYGRTPVAFVAGRGVELTDSDGTVYLDALSGIAVTGLGHCHPEVAEAIARQAKTLDHVSNLYLTEPQIALAGRLRDLSGFDARVFFANSGAEANECALKLARRASVHRHGRTRTKVVALEHGFHGRTFATLAATGQPAKHAPFEPLPEWFVHVPPTDPDALAAAIDDETAAVLLEVVQGEGGVLPVSDELLATARRRCDEVGALLVIDEVQTGLGRLGAWFGFQTTPVVPDVFTLAKALGNGLPIGACVARADIAAAFGPGDHATTFGGGPVVCAAALTTLEVIEREELVRNAAERGDELAAMLRALDDPRITEVRGRGLLVGLVLAEPIANALVDATRARGVIVGSAGPEVLRLAPPLIVSSADLAAIVDAVAGALKDVR